MNSILDDLRQGKDNQKRNLTCINNLGIGDFNAIIPIIKINEPIGLVRLTNY